MSLIEVVGLSDVFLLDPGADDEKQEGEKNGQEDLAAGATAGPFEKNPVLAKEGFDVLTGGVAFRMHGVREKNN